MGGVRLRNEQIYQAMVDDEAFAELPSMLAASLGARSCTIHWRDTDDHAEILSHSRYFSDGDMANYAANFTAFDDWTNRANTPGFVNRVWNAEELVSTSQYANGVFYNEWIRDMGDDTFHCMGTVMETGRGLGIIGVHRGRSQDTFDPDTVRRLERQVVHLRRMLTVRTRLVRETRRSRDLAALLDCNATPMLAVNRNRKLVHANAAGLALLEGGALLCETAGAVATVYAEHARALDDAVERAGRSSSAEATSFALRAPDGRVLEMTASPVTDRGASLVLLVARDPDGKLREALTTVDPRDSLAPRELLVARAVAQGLRNREIAERLGLTEGTIKVYLHNLYAKVGVSSRTELALRIGPISSSPTLSFDN